MTEHVPLCEREKLSYLRLLGISANQLSACLIWTPIGLLTNPLCTKFQINNVYTTLILLIGPIVGLIVPPLVGGASDATMFKWGRRRIWMVIGEALAFTGIMFISFCEKMSPTRSGQIAVMVIGQILGSVGGNIFNGPGRSMCTDLAPPNQQVTISNLCQVHNGLAGVISNLIGALELYRYAGMENEQFVLMISTIVGFVALFTSILCGHEEPLKEKPAAGVNPVMQVVESFKLYDFNLWLMASGTFFFQLGANQYNTQIGNFMGMNVFGGNPSYKGSTVPEEMALYDKYNKGVAHTQMLALIQTVIQVALSFGITPITNKIGLHITWLVGMCCGVVAQILFFFVFNQWAYLVCSILWAIDQVIGNSVTFSVLAIYAPKENYGGMMALLIFVGNMAGFIGQFAFTMGLGSVEWFKTFPGRLIGITAVFTAISAFTGTIGIKRVMNATPQLDEDDDGDNKLQDDPVPVA